MTRRVCAIVDYGSGNLRSAAKAFERAAAESDIDMRVLVTSDAQALASADRIVLPGVGAFADCRRGLDEAEAVLDTLERRVRGEGVPFLGICVGMQLMAERGLEHVTTRGLGWLPGDVVAIEGHDLRVPHMGWNELEFTPGTHKLLAGIDPGEHVYFVHSYRFAATIEATILASVSYGGRIAALVGQGNVAGTQFHPEKSQDVGLRLIGNFLGWQP